MGVLTLDLGRWTLDFRMARVAQLTERWSYKPEAEGLNPSLGTKPFSNSHFLILIFHACIRVFDIPNAQSSVGILHSRARLEE